MKKLILGVVLACSFLTNVQAETKGLSLAEIESVRAERSGLMTAGTEIAQQNLSLYEKTSKQKIPATYIYGFGTSKEIINKNWKEVK